MANAGYVVTLVGREMPGSPPLAPMPFHQVRLPLKYAKGKMFYFEYNYKLYQFLMAQDANALCAIDLDTIVPIYMASHKKGLPRMYDAHEFFSEMIEVKRRWHIHFFWKSIEKWMIPRFKHGYTVGSAIASEFKKLYGVEYALVRNMPLFIANQPHTLPEKARKVLLELDQRTNPTLPIILYQGAINEGRALPQLVTAMTMVNARLLMAGTGNMYEEIRQSIRQQGLESKIFMCGNVPPADLRPLTTCCYAGITIFDAFSKNQLFSLGNKFFDYIMAQTPQVCVNYPEYATILKDYEVAVPLENTNPISIANCLNKLIEDPVLHEKLKKNCIEASLKLNWESEEKTLLGTWEKLLGPGN